MHGLRLLDQASMAQESSPSQILPFVREAPAVDLNALFPQRIFKVCVHCHRAAPRTMEAIPSTLRQRTTTSRVRAFFDPFQISEKDVKGKSGDNVV